MIYRLIGRIIHPAALVYFKIFNHLTKQQRARVIVQNELGEILLIQTWIGHRQWSLPGGGVGRKETPLYAARRELQEEVGLNLAITEFQHLETIKIHDYEAPIFTVTIEKNQLNLGDYDRREVTHIGWFDSEKLPEVAPAVAQIVKKLGR